VIGAVFEQVLPDDVAQRPDALGVGPEVRVGFDEPAVVGLDAG